MLDFATLPAAETVTRYSAADPVQLALRARLAEMTEAEIDAIERDMDLYQRMGLMPAKLRAFLDHAPRALAA